MTRFEFIVDIIPTSAGVKDFLTPQQRDAFEILRELVLGPKRWKDLHKKLVKEEKRMSKGTLAKYLQAFEASGHIIRKMDTNRIPIAVSYELTQEVYDKAIDGLTDESFLKQAVWEIDRIQFMQLESTIDNVENLQTRIFEQMNKIRSRWKFGPLQRGEFDTLLTKMLAGGRLTMKTLPRIMGGFPDTERPLASIAEGVNRILNLVEEGEEELGPP